MLNNLLDDMGFANVAPKEVVQQYGDMEDWHHAVGTGPFIVDDFVSGASVSFSRNPDYWGYDSRYPKNQLPYVDNVKILIITDNATALSAIRTGKIDAVGTQTTNTDLVSWMDAKNLAQTTPELKQIRLPIAGPCIAFRVDKTPFTDIRVRKALNMAIDRDAIANSYYGGTTDSIPNGVISRTETGYYTPFDQWPADIKAGYTYNPQAAKKLLTEAGYPNGFKTNVVANATSDLDLLQVAKAYLLDIGVDMEIRPMDNTSYIALWTAMKHDQMLYNISMGSTSDPSIILLRYRTKDTNNTFGNSDPVYDDIITKYLASTDADTAKKLVVQADDYVISHFYSLELIGSINSFAIRQPWFKGYSGEAYTTGVHYARYWIDQNLKKQMGR
jgi:ABC-type transport system substrate-binding protein